MKTTFAILLIAFTLQLQAQDKYANTYACTKGKIHFFSSSPLEDIEATSNTAGCAFNTQTKKCMSKFSRPVLCLKTS